MCYTIPNNETIVTQECAISHRIRFRGRLFFWIFSESNLLSEFRLFVFFFFFGMTYFKIFKILFLIEKTKIFGFFYS